VNLLPAGDHRKQPGEFLAHASRLMLCRSSIVLLVLSDVARGEDKADCSGWSGWENPPDFRFLSVAMLPITLG